TRPTGPRSITGMRPTTCLGRCGFSVREAAGAAGAAPTRGALRVLQICRHRRGADGDRRREDRAAGCRLRSRLGQPGFAAARDRGNGRRDRVVGALDGMRPAICGKASLAACCLALLTAASGDDWPVVEMSNAVIVSRDQERLRVVFAAEGQPTLLFKPRA